MNSSNGVKEIKHEMTSSLSTLMPTVANNCYVNSDQNPFSQNHGLAENLLVHPMDSSSFSNLDLSQLHSLLPPNTNLSWLYNYIYKYPFDRAIDLICDPGFIEPLHEIPTSKSQLNASNLICNSQFEVSHLFPLAYNGSARNFNISDPQSFELSRNFVCLDEGGQKTPVGVDKDKGKTPLVEMMKKRNDKVDMNEGIIDGSDSDELMESSDKVEENANHGAYVGQKGKTKGLGAKNLMAERRRRKKLNHSLHALRSIVPNISKMDRAAILSDAIEYLKELLQKINDLRNEVESTPCGSSLPPARSSHLVRLPPPILPCHINAEPCPSSLPSPNIQPERVNVRVGEEKTVNIHMFCTRRPGLMLSTMKALDNLGLDVQQAAISCFDGFALDVFQAEQCKEGLEVLPEQIKSVLTTMVGVCGMKQLSA